MLLIMLFLASLLMLVVLIMLDGDPAFAGVLAVAGKPYATL
jgi:hypothetical protein